MAGDGVVDDHLGEQGDGDVGGLGDDRRPDHAGELAAARAQVRPQPPEAATGRSGTGGA
jgi:hypothetical protein